VARTLNRLSQTFVAKHTTPGLYGDGNGLYLQIAPGTAGDDAEYVTKSWIFRYAAGTGKEKRERKMGLGAYPLVSLALAREMAIELSLKRLKGVDPLEEREAEKRKKAAETVKSIVFEKAAEKYVAAHEAGWKNEVHRSQWTSTLKTYAYPVIGKVDLRDIDTGMVMQILQPIWAIKTETASRVRGRIESILDWGKVQGYREGENPARWTGHLDHLLPEKGKVRKVKPHPALPYKQMAEFMIALRARTGVSAKALEFTILTASRTTEVIEARWPEINKDGKIWAVPAVRMKGDRDHEVMLSDAALAVLEHQWKIRSNDWVFPGGHEGEPLSNAAMSELVKQMNVERKAAGLSWWIDPKQGGRAITVHGFRSSFKDWASDCTTFRDAVSEVALAHIEGDKVRAAYERTTFDEWRRALMADWANYCAKPIGGNKVVRPKFGTANG
jgi:integrase